ncbi:MAG: methyl-accepting chemotaxis protein [bacterium]|nr:methyl-accepting chemotaxis protein [bacterium]
MAFGKKDQKVGYQEASDNLIRLEKNEKMLADSARELLDVVSSISSFDVGMTHISGKLKEYAQQMANVSEANLALVEETSATLTTVKDSLEETTSALENLTEQSETITEKNDASKKLLTEASKLKEDVVTDTQIMNDKIVQLADLATEVEKIVESVQSIANQTNLLALNAAIEAARAGEQGRGFSVVADEVRNLADNTKQNLEGMRVFVKDIHVAAEEGKESVVRTLESTSQMSDKIDGVAVTVSENIEIMSDVAQNIAIINETMQELSKAAVDVNAALEESANDSQKLSEMTQEVYEDASKSSEYAQGIAKIDEDMSGIVSNMFEGLNTGNNAMSNDELKEVLEKAQKAHKAWTAKLKNMVDTMSLDALQTNSKKCAFGHFYHALNVNHPMLRDEWMNIDGLHHQVHSSGDEIIRAIKANDSSKAAELYRKTEQASAQMIAALDRLEHKVEEMKSRQIKIFE